MADLLQLVLDPGGGAVDLDDAAQVDGGADDDTVDDAVGHHHVDGFLEVLDLLVAVSHGGQQDADVRVLVISGGDGFDGPVPRIDELGGAELLGGGHPGAEGHLAVGQGGSVLDDQHALVGDQLRLLDGQGAGGLDNHGAGVDAADVLTQVGQGVGVHGAQLVDDDDVGHAQVGLTGVVGQLVTGAEGVDDDDLEVACIERGVVVAAVPEDDLGFLLGLVEDGLVVDTGVDDVAGGDVGLVLLHLFDGAVVLLEVLEGCEALDLLLDQVTVGHGVADGDDFLAGLEQGVDNLARGLALAAAGAHGGDADQGLVALDGHLGTAEQGEAGPGGVDDGGLVHHVLVGHVGVGEDDGVDAVGGDQLFDLAFVVDRDTVGVELAGELGRVLAAVDVGDLGGGESDDLELLVVAEVGVEVMEVASGGAHDEDFFLLHENSPKLRRWIAVVVLFFRL